MNVIIRIELIFIFALVIDGIHITESSFLVHLNFGWNGLDNGWYDFDNPINTRYGNFDNPDRWLLAIHPE